MKFLMSLLVLGLCFQTAFAKGKKETAKEHRHHHVHQHGAGELSVAFDGKQGKVEFKTPAESILGFEHAAKSEKDKATLAAAGANFEKNISSFIQFDSKLGCQFKKENIGMVQEKEENHSDFVAEFSVSCSQALQGTSVIFDFTSYAKLKDIDVSVLIDSLQKSLELKSEKKSLELK